MAVQTATIYSKIWQLKTALMFKNYGGLNRRFIQWEAAILFASIAAVLGTAILVKKGGYNRRNFPKKPPYFT